MRHDTGRSDSAAPRVSVLLPVFNAGRFLDESIGSIRSQTFNDFEMLVIDDGSTDGSGERLEQMAREDRRIVLKRRENQGLVATLNEMTAAARGEYLARMDADDVADPHRFARQVNALDANASLVAVGSDVYSIDPRGRRLMRLAQPRTHDDIIAFTMAVKGGSAMCHPTMMIRKSAMDAVGGYRSEFWPAEDADLVLRLGEIGALANLDEPLLSYRVHHASIGHTVPVKQRQAMFRAVSAALERRRLPPPEPGLSQVSPEEWGDGRNEVKWAWWAIGSGNLASARPLALEAVFKYPLSLDSWRVLACAVRGR